LSLRVFTLHKNSYFCPLTEFAVLLLSLKKGFRLSFSKGQLNWM
jgi:hypothetical protein